MHIDYWDLESEWKAKIIDSRQKSRGKEDLSILLLAIIGILKTIRILLVNVHFLDELILKIEKKKK